MNRFAKQTLALTAGIFGAALAGSGSPATAAPIFTINECVATAPSGFCNPALQADQFAISYASQVIQTIGGGNPFTQTGSVRLLDYELADIPQGSFQGAPEPFGYRLYVNFTGAGNANFGAGTIDGTYSAFAYSMYLDANSNSMAMNADRTVIVNADDILLATGSLSSTLGGEVHIRNAFAEGDFAIGAGFTPTAAGEAFFIDPADFYVAFDVSGNINSIVIPPGFPTCANGPCDYTLRIEGGGQAQFAALAISEPRTLLMFAAGLLALGLYGNRRYNR